MVKKILILLFLGCLAYVGFRYIWPIVHHPKYRDPSKYPQTLDSIQSQRLRLSRQKIGIKAQERAFIKIVTEQIFPYWYGTAWSYHGCTEKPNNGKIACGYFVTTVLRDAGVPLDRKKLAQCASEAMIRSLNQKKFISHHNNLDIKTFDQKLKQLEEGLYIIGLDNHTGFIIKQDNKRIFVHASGRPPFQVVYEPVIESAVLSKSKYKVLGNISKDPVFLKRWLNNTIK